MGSAPSRFPKTAEEWQAQTQRAHQLLQRAPINPASVARLSAAQRCSPQHLSGILSCLGRADFAASIRCCRLFHASGELRSSVPDPPKLGNPPLFVPAIDHQCPFDSILPELSVRRCSGFATLQGSESGAMALWRAPVWAQCRELRLCSALPRPSRDRGIPPADYAEQQSLLSQLAGLQQLRAMHVTLSHWAYGPAQLAEMIAALAPQLQLLHLSVCKLTAAQWLAHVPSLVHLRVLKLLIPAAAACDPAVTFGPLVQLVTLSVECEYGEYARPVDWTRAAPFCRALSLALRRLSVHHSLRVLEAVDTYPSFMIALTEDPSEANSWLPLPPLTHFAHDGDESNPELITGLLVLPSLIALCTATCPIRLLLSDHSNAELKSEDPRLLISIDQSKATLARISPTLARLKALACVTDSRRLDSLAALRRCGSIEDLGVAVAPSQLPGLIDALEAAAADRRPAAAPLDSAPLQRLSLVLDDPALRLALDWSPLLRLRNLREVSFMRFWHNDVFAPDDQIALAHALAQLPQFESLRFGGSASQSPAPCNWTAAFLRAVSASRSWVSCYAHPLDPFDPAFLNAQLRLLSAAECVALRHFALHWQPESRPRDVLRIVRCHTRNEPREHVPAFELPDGAGAVAQGPLSYEWRGLDCTGRTICGVRVKR